MCDVNVRCCEARTVNDAGLEDRETVREPLPHQVLHGLLPFNVAPASAVRVACHLTLRPICSAYVQIRAWSESEWRALQVRMASDCAA